MGGHHKDIVNEILACLEDFFTGDMKPDKTNLSRLEALLWDMKEEDPPLELCFRAAYSALHGDKDRAIALHKQAISLAPERALLYYIFAGSLDYMNQCYASTRMYIKAADLAGIETPFGQDMLLKALSIAYLEKYDDILEEWFGKYLAAFGDDDRLRYVRAKSHDQNRIAACFAACCSSGELQDWFTPEEDEAWRHLQ